MIKFFHCVENLLDFKDRKAKAEKANHWYSNTEAIHRKTKKKNNQRELIEINSSFPSFSVHIYSVFHQRLSQCVAETKKKLY